MLRARKFWLKRILTRPEKCSLITPLQKKNTNKTRERFKIKFGVRKLLIRRVGLCVTQSKKKKKLPLFKSFASLNAIRTHLSTVWQLHSFDTKAADLFIKSRPNCFLFFGVFSFYIKKIRLLFPEPKRPFTFISLIWKRVGPFDKHPFYVGKILLRFYFREIAPLKKILIKSATLLQNVIRSRTSTRLRTFLFVPSLRTCRNLKRSDFFYF